MKRIALVLLSMIAFLVGSVYVTPVHATGTTPFPTLTTPATSSLASGPVAVAFTLAVAQKPGTVKLTLVNVADSTTNREFVFADNALDSNHSYSGTVDLLEVGSTLRQNSNFSSVTTKIANVTSDGTRMTAGRYTVAISYQDAANDPSSSASSTNVGLDACEVGTFSAATSGFLPLSGGCDPASPGHYVNTVGATTDIACSQGKFQLNRNSASCLDAPAGSYVVATGQTAPIPCPANTWTTGKGSTSSSDCTATFATPHIYWLDDIDPSTPGHSISTAITGTSGLLGTFTVYETAEVPNSGPSIGVTSISINGAGTNISSNTTSNITSASRFSIKFSSQGSTFASRTFEDLQAICSPGRYSIDGFAPCLKAPAGRFVAYPQSTQTEQCIAGTFQPAIGQMSCIQAEPGHYVNQSGAASQQECRPGTYQPDSAKVNCIQASLGSYVSDYAARAQSTCAVGTTTTAEGSTVCVPIATNISANATNKKLEKGKKAKLTSMIKPTKKAKLKWSVSGGCKISGLYIVAPKKVTNCTLTLKQTVTSGTKTKKITTSTSRVGITVS